MIPSVSIIVPAFNHVRYIQKCLESIFAQDYPAIELIVIDDGSTDGTQELIQRIYQLNPARFSFLSQPNSGLIKTLNKGLKLASGTYFCELASDDVLLPGSISQRVDYLQRHPELDAVFTDAYLIKKNRMTESRVSANHKLFSSATHDLKNLIERDCQIFFPSGLFKKSFLDNLGGFCEDFRDFEDLAMSYQLAVNGKIGYLNQPLMGYRKHGANNSSLATMKFSLRKEKIMALEKLTDDAGVAIAPEVKKCIWKHLYREYVRFGKFVLKYPQRCCSDEVNIILNQASSRFPWGIRMRLFHLCYLIRDHVIVPR